MKAVKMAVAAALTLTSTAASAQTLKKEITIDKEIVPEQRAATRLNVTPRLHQPTVKQSRLEMSDRSTASAVPTMVDRLEPAREAADTAAAQRGYVAGGYFPSCNYGLSAGYRIVENDETRGGVWLQLDGTDYDRKDLAGEKHSYSRTAFTVGGDFARRLNKRLKLEATAAYSYLDYNRGWLESAGNQGVQRFGIDAGLAGYSQQCDYKIMAEVGYTGFGKVDSLYFAGDDVKTVGELDFGVVGGVSSPIGDGSRFGLNVAARFNRYSHFNGWQLSDSCVAVSAGGSKTLGVVKFNPYWSMRGDELSATVGLDIDLAVNSGRFANAAPHVAFNWTPRAAGSLVTLTADVTGGVHANTLGSLLDYTPYVNSTMAYKHSRVPLDAVVGVTVGPFAGTSIGVKAGYSIADDWLMPVVVDGANLWDRMDLKGWRAGATVTHSSRWIKELTLSYDYAPNSGDKGYYLWRDHANHAVDAEVTVSPLKELDVTVGFESRWGRNVLGYESQGGVYGISLGRSNNLSLGAVYRLNGRVSIFARGENLLDTESYMLYDIPAQGVTGLVGATYKF